MKLYYVTKSDSKIYVNALSHPNTINFLNLININLLPHSNCLKYIKTKTYASKISGSLQEVTVSNLF